MALYLHGFASGPTSRKARRFVEWGAARGLDVVAPALDEGDFEHLSITKMRALIGRLAEAERAPKLIIGSSLGGYLSTLHVAEHPVDALVLMAPAVNFASRLIERTDPLEIERWQRNGSTEIDHFGERRKLPLAYDFLRDAMTHEPYPRVTCPTLVLQGRRDDVVPLEVVSRWTAAQPDARLVTFDSGHELVDVLEAMVAETDAFLAEIPAFRR